MSIYNNFCSLLNESQTDELTGLANRKTFDTAITKIFSEPETVIQKIDNERRANLMDEQPKEDKTWIAVIDIDDFKLVNDQFGHVYGDEILINLAQIIRINFRFDDLQFRFGGEEFVIVLNAANRKLCQSVLERFRTNVENYDFPSVNKVTVSIGAVEFKKGTFHITSIDYADKALYFSKKNGKNQINFFEDILKKGLVKESKIESGDIDLF